MTLNCCLIRALLTPASIISIRPVSGLKEFNFLRKPDMNCFLQSLLAGHLYTREQVLSFIWLGAAVKRWSLPCMGCTVILPGYNARQDARLILGASVLSVLLGCSCSRQLPRLRLQVHKNETWLNSLRCPQRPRWDPLEPVMVTLNLAS